MSEAKVSVSNLLTPGLDKQVESTPDQINMESGKHLFYCGNEDHNPKVGFDTLAQLKLHVARYHKCPDKSCSFANEHTATLVDHYETCHVQGPYDICDLCCAPIASNDEQKHYNQCHKKCNSCQEYFMDHQTLKAHELRCVTVTSYSGTRHEPPSFISSKNVNKSMNIDKSNVLLNFSETLIKMMHKMNLSPQEIEEGKAAISRYASEKMIARARERGRAEDRRRQNDLFFNVPTFNGNQEETNCKDLHHYLKQSKIECFDASAMESDKNAIENFLAIDKINASLGRLCIQCKLTDTHAVYVLNLYLTQRVQDEIEAYKKMSVCDLNYRSLLQVLQYLYCPIDIARIESSVLGAKKKRDENIFIFAADIFNKLDLCSRKLNSEARESYIEEHMKKSIFLNLPSSVQREIEAKETIWSSFSSQELLDFALAHRDKEEHSDYSGQFTFYQVGQSNVSDQNDESDSDADTEYNESEPEQPDPEQPNPTNRFHPDYAKNDAIKEKLQNLCFMDKRFARGQWCLFCLGRHHYLSCKKYSGELHDELHMINDFPCGYHTEEECLSNSWNGKIRNEY